MPITAVVTAQVSAGTTAISRIVPTNIMVEDFSLAFGLTVQGSAGDATLNVAVQHTFDDIYDPAVSATWFDHSTVSGRTPGSIDGSYTEPVRAVRVNVKTGTAAGVATRGILKLVQSGW